MEDARARFTVTAEAYARYRPSYPPSLIDWIVEASRIPPAGTVADVGCGTGIATRLLNKRGLRVFGIDPNEAMLVQAGAGGGRFVRGEATSTALRTRSVDLVSVGQAFHWFANSSALSEFGRILKPSGSCVVFWNTRSSSPFMDAYEDLLLRYSSEYRAIPKPDEATQFLRQSRAVSNLLERTFDNVQVMNWDALMGRANSSSYVAHGVADRSGFDRDLKSLFDRYASSGQVEFRYDCLSLLFQLPVD